MTRDKILKKWVEQPPAEPNIQYLRDAERINAWKQLGSRSHILDIASEANVTSGLDADTITRVDFSPDAIEHAQEILGNKVDQYEVVDPETPSLPFEDEQFDSAVCIGPYDWKFLDVQQLTAEIRRVIDSSGLFVFSVPTPRSPYAVNNRNKYRYYTPNEALDLISPHWQLSQYDLVYQYPGKIHHTINLLPDQLQEPFVDTAWTLTDKLTKYDRWSNASYLVLGLQPLNYERNLDQALNSLFRPAEQNGFWDQNKSSFIRALIYEQGENGLTWRRDDRVLWRYAPFALMGAMYWRESVLSGSDHDDKLRQALDHFTTQIRIEDAHHQIPSYGIGPLISAFSRAARVFDEHYEQIARRLYEYSTNEYDFNHAEDNLLLYGWADLYELEGEETVKASINDGLWQVIERLSSERLFHFDNETTRRHQNQMYTLWGLCRAIEVTDKPGYLDSVEQVLNYTIEHRMRSDGAFIWEDVSLPRKALASHRSVLDRRPPHWEFLYECHQTFFVNAVAHYYQAGGSQNYDRAVRRAMTWIHGDNPLDVDLVEQSGIGVPLRQMTVDGQIDVQDQMYKGVYEIGSWIMALTNLQTGMHPISKQDVQSDARESASRTNVAERPISR